MVRQIPMKPKKDKKKCIIIACICCFLILLLLAAAIFLFVSKNKDFENVDELYKRYISYIEKKEYDKMYAMLDDRSRINISETDFIERNRKIYEGLEAKNLKLDIQYVEKSKKNSAYIFYNMSMDTLAGPINFENTAIFHKTEKRGCRLEWDHSLIFPDLEENDKIKVVKLEAKRGDILDRNGAVLAGEGIASSVGLVPKKMSRNSQKDIEKLAKYLDVNVKSIQKKLKASWVKEDSFVPIKTIEKLEELKLSLPSLDKVTLAKAKLQSNLLAIQGVMLKDVETRVYPYRESTAHLTGYVQNVTAEDLQDRKNKGYDNNSVIGKSGLEAKYEEELRGKDGHKISIVTAEGLEKQILAFNPNENGTDLKLTIDIQIQSILYETFKQDKSCSVAMNPKTGEVLALVSTPSFNANDFVYGISVKKWNSLNNNKKKPLWNRFRASWSPGSSLKPVIGAIGVTTGRLRPGDYFADSGYRWQKDESWGNYHVTTLHAYEGANLHNAMIYSDNIYFAKAALKIGSNTLVNQMKAVGFQEDIPFEISMTSSQCSNNGKIDREIQLADSGYGQGEVLVNPLHLAGIYSAFVNEGSMIAPYLEYNKEKKPAFWKNNVFSKEAVDVINRAMIQVIENPKGTGHSGKIKGTLLAGKTGTAEIKTSKEDKSGTELGWFAVYTADNKRSPLLLVNMVEDVKHRGGSHYVVKKDKAILEQIFKEGLGK